MFLLEVVKEFDHFSILSSVAASEQQANCRNIRNCISREGFFWQQETGLEPRALLFLRGAGAAGGAIGAGGTGVRGRGLGGWSLGIGGDSEVARLRGRLNDDPFCFLWEIAVSEQSGLIWAVNGNPMHEALNTAGVPALIHEKETDLGMMHKRMRAGIGKNESEKSGTIIRTSDISLEVLDLFIACVRAECQAAIRGIWSRGEAWQAAMVV